MGWTVRKVAGMMDVFLDIEAKDEGLFTSLKTKLKNTDNLLLYSGVTKTKGLSDDEVRIQTTPFITRVYYGWTEQFLNFRHQNDSLGC